MEGSPNTLFIYPTVPSGEEDPRVRINVMINIFNAGLPTKGQNGGVDKGLFHEIMTACYLVKNYKINHGKEISRPLTPAERGLQKGDAQMILVPLKDGGNRELDMVYVEDGRPYIVEAKNKKTADHRQLEANVQLARTLGGGVVYALTQKSSQEEAIKTAYDKLPDQANLPPLEIIQISEKLTDIYSGERPQSLKPIPTLAKIWENISRHEGLLEFDSMDEEGDWW
ncbi:uncharacterized protein F4807DRAFT_446737 [Annulohypoxylon truncatum]|uniref:uncharacterized protein n=1 Tax=Annulohypoxylon truncatum TaxID=327061 RepID=UPI0020087706|nr:uncharacterized protein F4807DRAFT_446737 [Annulohypoxylon truncatum]KAI1204530.1 hypothetical protein F4807DRAFT_446737 [Annulohypoxylon truncatum]